MEKTKFVVSSEDRTAFYRGGEFYTNDIFLARHFPTEDEATCWRDHAFSSFQKAFLTEVVPIKVSITLEP